MTRLKQISLALGLSLAAVSSSNVVAGPTNVPFKAAVTTLEYVQQTQPDADCRGARLSGTSVGAGTASHLGAVVVTATDISCYMGPVSTFKDGVLTFKAANGDTLTATYMGTLVQQGSTNVYTVSGGTFVISGGTGRFVNATGGGELRGTEVLSLVRMEPSKAQLQAVGTISY